MLRHVRRRTGELDYLGLRLAILVLLATTSILISTMINDLITISEALHKLVLISIESSGWTLEL